MGSRSETTVFSRRIYSCWQIGKVVLLQISKCWQVLVLEGKGLPSILSLASFSGLEKTKAVGSEGHPVVALKAVCWSLKVNIFALYSCCGRTCHILQSECFPFCHRPRRHPLPRSFPKATKGQRASYPGQLRPWSSSDRENHVWPTKKLPKTCVWSLNFFVAEIRCSS